MSCVGVFSSKCQTPLFFLWQLYPYSEDAGILISGRRQNGFVASLADIGWIDREEEEEEDYYGNPR